MYNNNMDNNTIDEKKLAEAKEKLACHIMPPGHHDDEASESPWMKAMADAERESASSDASNAAGSSGTDDFIDPDGNVLLTRMTTAGG
jgi:hypothetical protein